MMKMVQGFKPKHWIIMALIVAGLVITAWIITPPSKIIYTTSDGETIEIKTK